MVAIVKRSVTSFAGTNLNTITSTAPRLSFYLVSGLDDGLLVRGIDTVIPGTGGRTSRTRVRDRRVIEIEGLVSGAGATVADQTDDFRDAMETLRALFAPTASAGSLIVLLEDQVRSATISCRPLPTIQVKYIIDVAAIMSVEFEAIGNDWSVA